MENNRIFDYEALSRQYEVQPEVLEQLVKEVREEFPDDELLFELHVIRALEWLHSQVQH